MPDKRVTELAAIDTVIDTDLVMVIDDPAGTPISKKATRTQLLVNVARTNVSNTFTGDQTVDGDLFVTGEVIPTRFAEQKAKIDLFTGTPVGDPSGSRTVMSRSLISGLSIRHDEALAEGRLSVGNYDTQIYQPLKIEVESFQVHTGISPAAREERVRVHPSGGVTVGGVLAHDVDPGIGMVRAAGVDLKEGIPPDPSADTARLYALDVNGYTQVEMRDGNAKVVRFASDNVLIAKVSATAITRGQCLYLAGASGANPLVGLARANSLTTMPAVGVALDSGAVNAFIRVLLLGTFQLLNTAAFAEGDRLYVSPTTAGALTATRPTAPDYAQRVGVVTRSHATQGEMVVLTTAVESDPRQHHVSHEPGGSDELVNVAWTNLANTFTQTQTMQGVIATDAYFNSLGATPLNADNLTSGTVPLARLPATLGDVVGPAAATHNAIALFSGTTGKLLKDSAATMASMAQKSIDNNFTVNQTFQGTVQATGLGTTPLNATNLLSGTVPDARLSANVQMKPLVMGDLPAHATAHNAGGADALTALSAAILTTGALPFARVAVSAASKLLGRGASGAGAMEEITLGTGLTMSGTTLNAAGSALPGNLAYTDAANVFTQDQMISKATARLMLQDTSSSVDTKRWHLISSGGIFYISPWNDAGTSEQGIPLTLYRGGSMDVSGELKAYGMMKAGSDMLVVGRLQLGSPTALSASYPALRNTGARMEVVLGDASAYAGFTCANISTSVGGTSLADLTCGPTNFQSGLVMTGGTMAITGNARVSGRLQIGYAGAESDSYPALRNTGATMDCVLGAVGNWANFQCLSIYTVGTGTSLGDLTVRGATNFAGGLTGNGSISFTNGHLYLGYYVYPGNIAGPGPTQASWYLSSHSSYGLFTNTGLYVTGDVWYSGISVTAALAGKHPLMTAGGGNGPITLAYATYSANHNNPTQAAAPAGGTGVAAGGWSTAANRDLAIASINAARTDIANCKQVLGHVISSLKGMGILP